MPRWSTICWTRFQKRIPKNVMLRRSKKKYMFSIPARFLFLRPPALFFFFFLFEKTVKKTRKIWSFPNFFFFFFPEEKIAWYRNFRKIAFYIFRLPHQLFHLLWKLSRMSGGHLEKIGRPVVLENVSGGHFEKKKENKAPPPSFFPWRQDAEHVCFFTSPKVLSDGKKKTHWGSVSFFFHFWASLRLFYNMKILRSDCINLKTAW